MIARITTVAVVTALGSFAAMPAQAAASPCKSTWSQLEDIYKKLSPIVVKGICTWTSSGDAAGAAQCVRDYEAAVAQVQKIVKEYNAQATSGKIGPRGLGTNTWYDGALTAERTFIGQPVMSDNYKVEFQGTGGSSKKAFTVTICFVNDKGDDGVASRAKTFETNDASWTESFSGVYGLRPIVYLRNSTFVTTNAHKYKLRGTEGTEPKRVRDARAQAGR